MADPNPVNPDVDPQTGAGEPPAVPINDIQEQADPTTSPYGEQKRTGCAHGRCAYKFSAADLDALAASNGVSQMMKPTSR
jgi:hypothetical protein